MKSGGVLSVLIAALAWTGADAFNRDFESISKGLSGGQSSTSTSSTSSFHTNGVTIVSASVRCSSNAYATSYSDWKDSYIEAVANVVKEVCSSKFTGSVVKATEEMSDFAKAWARVTAEASAQCTSKTSGGGKASGCAYASAAASAFEEAFAEAHAAASAEAFAKYCTCANADAWSFGDASLFLELTAEAFAQAESTACASGNQISTASASVDCQAHIFAQTYAFAAAQASVAGKCYGKRGDAKASTKIEAEVDALVYDESQCIVKTRKSGLSATRTTSNASTRSVYKAPAYVYGIALFSVSSLRA